MYLPYLKFSDWLPETHTFLYLALGDHSDFMSIQSRATIILPVTCHSCFAGPLGIQYEPEAKYKGPLTDTGRGLINI